MSERRNFEGEILLEDGSPVDGALIQVVPGGMDDMEYIAKANMQGIFKLIIPVGTTTNLKVFDAAGELVPVEDGVEGFANQVALRTRGFNGPFVLKLRDKEGVADDTPTTQELFEFFKVSPEELQSQCEKAGHPMIDRDYLLILYRAGKTEVPEPTPEEGEKE